MSWRCGGAVIIAATILFPQPSPSTAAESSAQRSGQLHGHRRTTQHSKSPAQRRAGEAQDAGARHEGGPDGEC